MEETCLALMHLWICQQNEVPQIEMLRWGRFHPLFIENQRWIYVTVEAL